MEYFDIISAVFAFLLLTAVIIGYINEIGETKKMKAEREECFLMISRCSKLLRLWEINVYITNADFNFLKHRIYLDYIRIHKMPFELVSSERERRILAEGFHWTSTSRENKYVRYRRKTNQRNAPCPYIIVLNMAIDGFAGCSKRENFLVDLEWIYYMWLTATSIQARSSREFADWEELKKLCFKIEEWTTDMDSQYLRDKIKECREQINNQKKT